MAILYDKSHKEASFKNYYTDLTNYLNKAGEAMDVLRNTPITAEALSAYDVFIVSFPQHNFNEKEIDIAVNFVEEGGGLFLVGEEWNFNRFKSNLNSLSKRFDITFNDDEVLDPVNRVLNSPDRIGDYYFSIKELEEHPITEGVDELNIYGGCSLKVNSHSKIIVRGSKHCYSSEGYYKPGDCPPLLTSLEFGKGRVVCLGDGSMLRNSFINEGDNKKLAVNIIRWLSNGKSKDGEEIIKDIEILEKKYNKLDLLYSSKEISQEEYRKKIEQYGHELEKLESKLKLRA
jgi:uncharacterized membrane protein